MKLDLPHRRIVTAAGLMAIVFIVLGSTMIVSWADTYPSPPPSGIVLNTATISMSGFPSKDFNISVSDFDSHSPVTALSMTTNTAQSSIQMQIFQLSSLPTGVPNTPGSPIIVIQFNLPSGLDSSITAVTITFQIPLSSVTDVKLSSLVVERYSSGVWSALTTTLTHTDSQFVYLQATAPGLSVFEIAGQTSSIAPPSYTLLLAVVTGVIIIAGLSGEILIARRTRGSMQR